MAISFLSLNTFRRGNRIIVQYYSAEKNSEHCTCPECGWHGQIGTDGAYEISCIEVHCPRCATALAMISSRLPCDGVGVRCI